MAETWLSLCGLYDSVFHAVKRFSYLPRIYNQRHLVPHPTLLLFFLLFFSSFQVYFIAHCDLIDSLPSPTEPRGTTPKGMRSSRGEPIGFLHVLYALYYSIEGIKPISYSEKKKCFFLRFFFFWREWMARKDCRIAGISHSILHTCSVVYGIKCIFLPTRHGIIILVRYFVSNFGHDWRQTLGTRQMRATFYGISSNGKQF